MFFLGATLVCLSCTGGELLLPNIFGIDSLDLCLFHDFSLSRVLLIDRLLQRLRQNGFRTHVLIAPRFGVGRLEIFKDDTEVYVV